LKIEVCFKPVIVRREVKKEKKNLVRKRRRSFI